MSATDPQTLLAQAKCYMCLGVSLAEALQLALLAQIANSAGGGSDTDTLSFSAPVVRPNAFGNYVNSTGKAALLFVMFHNVNGAGNESVNGVTVNGQTYVTGCMDDDTTVENHLTLLVPVNAGDAYSIVQITGDPLASTVGDGAIPAAAGHLLIPISIV